MSKLLIFTGAGVSQESGIPTFEELGDVREKLSRLYFIKHPKELYSVLLELYKKLEAAEPNAAHKAIAESGSPVITMNIDGLHHKAGTTKLIEIHGNLQTVFCSKCKQQYPFSQVIESINCPECNMALEPNVVLYGDALMALEEAFKWVDDADELLVVGTSFYTSTASYIVDRARATGKKVTVINEAASQKVPAFLLTLKQ